MDSALCTGSLACCFLGVPLGPHVPSPGTHPPDQSCLDSSYWAVSWLFHAFLPCLPVERKTSYSFPRIIPIFSLPWLCNWGEGLTLVETHGCHVSHSFLSRTSDHPWAFHTPQKLVRRSLYSELWSRLQNHWLDTQTRVSGKERSLASLRSLKESVPPKATNSSSEMSWRPCSASLFHGRQDYPVWSPWLWRPDNPWAHMVICIVLGCGGRYNPWCFIVSLFLAVLGLRWCTGGCSLVAGFSLWWLLWLQSTGSRARGLWSLQHVGSVVAAPRLLSTGSVVLANGLSCSTARGIFPDQGWNPCLLPLAGGFLVTEPPRKYILNIINERRFLVLLNCGTHCVNCHQDHDLSFSCCPWHCFLPKVGMVLPKSWLASCVV